MKVGDVLQLGKAKYTVVGIDFPEYSPRGVIRLLGPGSKTHESTLFYVEAAGKWHHGRYLSRGGKKTWYHREGDRFTSAY